jgi:hypothetical protein
MIGAKYNVGCIPLSNSYLKNGKELWLYIYNNDSCFSFYLID